jgi:hypothetical protein
MFFEDEEGACGGNLRLPEEEPVELASSILLAFHKRIYILSLVCGFLSEKI